MDITSSSEGGDDAWPVNRYLNVWVTPGFFERPDVFGSTSFISNLANDPGRDGCVIRFDVVGRNAGNHFARTQGTTLVHEVGHWLNLMHPSDSGCNGDDFCNDTPTQSGPTLFSTICANVTFPLTANACSNTGSNGVMYDNLMDNTNDNCGRRMFTRDQVTRMRAVFQEGGPRRSFIDNYFKLIFSGYRNCIEEFDYVMSPFCEAAGNINWSITGPASFGNPQGFSVYVNPWNSTADGEATLTASWNNLTSSLAIPVGWGLEKSTYKVNPGSLDKSLISGNFHPASSNTSGIISFTGATGAGTNWRIINQYGQVSFSGYLNSFNVSVGQGSSVTVAVDFPTICGTKTAIYIFAKSNYQFGLSPNPANNNLRVSGTTLDAATARGGFNYDVEIMSNLGQLVKNLKNVRSGQDKDIDISGLRSNQFYTIRFISNSEVVVQQFFKG